MTPGVRMIWDGLRLMITRELPQAWHAEVLTMDRYVPPSHDDPHSSVMLARQLDDLEARLHAREQRRLTALDLELPPQP